MIRLNFRLQRSFILSWCIGLWAFVVITPPSYLSYYPKLSDRGPLVENMQENTGTTAMYGIFSPPGTIGQFTNWEIGAWVGILSAVMSVLLITRLHRTAENNGSAEMVSSTGLSRSRIVLQAYLTVVLVAAMIGGVSAAILIALRYLSTKEITVEGALAFGTTITITMVGAMAVASIAQALWGAPTRANPALLGLATVGIAFILRMYADTASPGWAHHLNWISPLGWRGLISAFTHNDWGRAAILIGLCTVLLGIALGLNTVRETNTSLFHVKHRRICRTRKVSGLYGLTLLIHRNAIIAWAITTFILLITMLPLIGSLLPQLSNDDATLNMVNDLLPVGDLQTEFIIYIFRMAAILIAVGATQPIVALISLENQKLIDVSRSTGLKRWAPLGASMTTSFSTLALSSISAALGGLIGLNLQDSTVLDSVGVIGAAALSMILQALVFLGFATLLAGWAPRFIHLIWPIIALAAAITLLGAILGLSQTQIDYSPFSQTLKPNGENWEPLMAWAGAGVALALIGLMGAQRRDLQ